jgi:biotin transport system substrate-specific component
MGYDIIAMIGGTIVLYACGVTWLKILTGMSWPKTLAVGMYPFLIGDVLKIAAAAAIARAIRPVIHVAGKEVSEIYHGKARNITE